MLHNSYSSVFLSLFRRVVSGRNVNVSTFYRVSSSLFLPAKNVSFTPDDCHFYRIKTYFIFFSYTHPGIPIYSTKFV